MPKVESDSLNKLDVQTLTRAIRSIMSRMHAPRYQWMHGSPYLYFTLILPKMPGSTVFGATN